MKIYLALLVLYLFCQPIFGQDYLSKEIHFYTDSIMLFGDVYIPSNPDKTKIGIAIIQGSGNSGRFNNWSRLFAETLAENGYYILLPDKRGCGKSKGDWKNASFLDLAKDAINSARKLKELYGLDKIGVMGLSQGGKIVPVVATSSDVDFIINISGSSVSVEKQIIHEVTNTAINEGLTPNEIIDVLKLHVIMKQYVLDGDWSSVQRKFEEISQSTWAEFGQTFPNEPNLWIWEWSKKNYKFDPMNYWAKVKQNVFIAYGSEDEKDNVPVFESIYLLQDGFFKANKFNYEIHLYQAGHSLRSKTHSEGLNKNFLNDLIIWLSKT
jgi:esterase/lipase